jgi:hypothetical protein
MYIRALTTSVQPLNHNEGELGLDHGIMSKARSEGRVENPVRLTDSEELGHLAPLPNLLWIKDIHLT